MNDIYQASSLVKQTIFIKLTEEVNSHLHIQCRNTTRSIILKIMWEYRRRVFYLLHESLDCVCTTFHEWISYLYYRCIAIRHAGLVGFAYWDQRFLISNALQFVTRKRLENTFLWFHQVASNIRLHATVYMTTDKVGGPRRDVWKLIHALFTQYFMARTSV